MSVAVGVCVVYQMSRVFGVSGDRPDAPNIVLIFTDGASNIQPELTVPRAITAKQSGAHIIVFGVCTQSHYD